MNKIYTQINSNSHNMNNAYDSNNLLSAMTGNENDWMRTQ